MDIKNFSLIALVPVFYLSASLAIAQEPINEVARVYASSLTEYQLKQSFNGSYASQRDEFEFYPVTLNQDAIKNSLSTKKGELHFPSVTKAKPWKGRVTKIDSKTSEDGTVAFFGEIVDRESGGVIGEFAYASAKNSMPYLYVSAFDETYEIIGSPVGSEEFVLKHFLKKEFDTPIDFEDAHELLSDVTEKHKEHKATLVDFEDSQSSRANRSGQCLVKLGVGRTYWAQVRNPSIQSAVVVWVSNLNSMLSDINVNCGFSLVQPSSYFSYTEYKNLNDPPSNNSENIMRDLFRMSGQYHSTYNPGGYTYNQIKNWKSSVKADIFVLVQRADNLEPGDYVEGVAMAPLVHATTYPCTTGSWTYRCGQYAVVRDDYTYRLRVFAHEIGHLAGVNHPYAYGYGNNTYGGAGFSGQSNGTDVNVTSGNAGVVTVMANNGRNGVSTCYSAEAIVDSASCSYRLPFFASKNKLRQVSQSMAGWVFTKYRYFPEHYPQMTSNPYSFPYSTPTYSMKAIIEHGMNWQKNIEN